LYYSIIFKHFTSDNTEQLKTTGVTRKSLKRRSRQ